MKHLENYGRLCRIQCLGLPFALALLTLLLTGCPRNEYEIQLQPQADHLKRTLVFYCADGEDSNGVPKYARFDTNELAMIAARYQVQGMTSASGRHEVQGEFTNALPDDVGGAGTYTYLATSLGAAGFYVERFRGSDDLVGITARQVQAANQFTDLLLGWSRMTLRREPGYEHLRHFLNTDFRRDLQNLSAYWWQGQLANNYKTNADEEFVVRCGQYLLERNYFTPGEFPRLGRAFTANDPQPLLRHLQRLVAHKLGKPDADPVPACLAFLGDESTLEKSFDQYLATTESYHAKIKQWKQDQKSNPALKQPQPDEVAADAFQNLIDLDSFGQTPDQLTVRLSLRAAPLHTNGRWNDSLRQVVWDPAIGSRTQTNTLPFACYANWVSPDDAFQSEHFGKVALIGDQLAEYCLWRGGQDTGRGNEWDAFLASLQPGAGLTNRLESFRFTGEPTATVTNGQSNASNSSVWPRNLLQTALH